MRTAFVALAVFAVFGCIVAETATAYVRAGKEDFLNELVFGSTTWTKGFTARKFSSVRVGMSPDEVKGILGDPVLRHAAADGTDVWHYAYGKRRDKNGVFADCNYTDRVVAFADGKVSRVRGSFYFD